MQIVLFRHAHKGVTPFEDPHLSSKGLTQSLEILNLCEQNKLPWPTTILVSPKIRTSQTLKPVSIKKNISLEINELLNLQLENEFKTNFSARVQKFLSLLNKYSSSDVIYICTHYDWIDEAMTLINCNVNLTGFEFSNWAPTQFLSFEVLENQWTLTHKGDCLHVTSCS
jgi:phosphohistidine phosphatase SixA